MPGASAFSTQPHNSVPRKGKEHKQRLYCALWGNKNIRLCNTHPHQYPVHKYGELLDIALAASMAVLLRVMTVSFVSSKKIVDVQFYVFI